MSYDLERTAFYCKQCRTIVEGGVLTMPEGIMVSCHGATEIVHEGMERTPASATQDDPHLVTVFKKKAETNGFAPRRPNVRFYCKPDDKLIGHFQYQEDTSSAAVRSGRIHVFVVKCTGEKCSNREHIRAFTKASLDYQQLFGDGPPLVLDLNPAVPIPKRRNKADVRGHNPDVDLSIERLPGVRDSDVSPGENLPPTRLITLEED